LINGWQELTANRSVEKGLPKVWARPRATRLIKAQTEQVPPGTRICPLNLLALTRNAQEGIFRSFFIPEDNSFRKSQKENVNYMTELDSRIETYHKLSHGYLSVRSLVVRQFSAEHGWASQSMEVVLGDEIENKLVLIFADVRDLRIADLHPGVKCHLQIINIVSRQFEGLKYQVFNKEQDFTLSFYCREFNAAETHG
jgi:hypothetical protein